MVSSADLVVSILLYWDLSLLILVESLSSATRDNDPVYNSVIPTVRAYQEEVVSSITKTVERVLSLSPEETFNLKKRSWCQDSHNADHITCNSPIGLNEFSLSKNNK